MTIEYTTTEIAPGQRFEYWKEVVCRHCIAAHSDPLDTSDFDGSLRVRTLGAMDLCTVRAPVHHWERTAGQVRSEPDDDLWLGFMDRSAGALEQGGRHASLGARDIVLYDADQPFRFDFGGQAAHLMRIPRRLLAQRVRGVERLTAVVLDERRPGLVPLREMLLQAVVHPSVQADAAMAARFGETLLELLVLSLELQDAPGRAAERDLYAVAMRHIRAHLADPDLSPEGVAQAIHVSPRTLVRAFARHQKTPMATIWHERLLSSRLAIEQGRARSVSQAALDNGFTDFSHFSHAFRKAFGTAPSALLPRR